jgi:hypothetical protein
MKINQNDLLNASYDFVYIGDDAHPWPAKWYLNLMEKFVVSAMDPFLLQKNTEVAICSCTPVMSITRVCGAYRRPKIKRCGFAYRFCRAWRNGKIRKVSLW